MLMRREDIDQSETEFTACLQPLSGMTQLRIAMCLIRIQARIPTRKDTQIIVADYYRETAAQTMVK
jgi:hypothetical protein